MPIALLASTLVLLAVALPAIVMAQEGGDGFERQRREMLDRQRRVILNNDGDDHLLRGEFSLEAFLEMRTTPLPGSHVDSIFYCTGRPFGMFLHKTQIGDMFTIKEPFAPARNNVVADMLEMGTDPLQVMVEFCREHDLEVFWSMRMNDVHDGSHTPERPHYYWSSFKEQHPEFLMGTRESPPRHGSWSAVDYTHPEVRDFLFRVFEEVCQNYDVDGIELDFFRHLNYFKTVAFGGQATEEELEMMTDLIRRIRTMAEEEGRRRGKPILVAVRVPDSVEFCRGMGFDLERWLAEGLVDILVATCYFQLNPWEYLVELGRRYGVKVYPGLSESRLQGEMPPLRRQSQESYRARALRVWDSGADGVYLFNFFNPRAAMLHEIGDPEALARLDKTYFVTMRPSRQRSYNAPHYWLAGGEQFLNLPILSPQDPLNVAAGEGQEVELMVADDVAEMARQGLGPTATCHIMAAGGDSLSVSLNGVELQERRRADQLLELPLPADLLRRGSNVFRFTYDPAQEAEGENDWSVEWTADAMPAPPWQHDRVKPGVVFAELQDGALLVADRGTAPGDYLYFSYPWSASATEESVAEVEVKVVSGVSNVIFGNGVATDRLVLHPDRIETHISRLRHDMDTTDDFHTYRIVVHGSDLRVYVDGELRLDATGRFTGAPQRNAIHFGAASSGTEGEALWRAVRFRTAGGATLYDLAVSVRFAHE